MSRFRSRPILPIAIAIAAACRSGSGTDSGAGPVLHATAETIVQGEVGQRVDDYLKRAARFGFSGAVLVAKDGRIVLQAGYGLADREKGSPVTPNTVFSIGSLTKQFTAAAILSLEEKKQLKTRDPISKFFPGAPADKAEITIHQLLTHSAGLPEALGGDFDRISRDSLVRLAFAAKLLWPPGTQYQYSNVGYSLLAAVIEVVSKRPYESYLREALFDRVGLTETGYNLAWGADRLAVGYQDTTRWGNSLDRWKPDGPWWHVVGNGEIQSTVGDMYRWIAALDSGRVLADSSRQKLITPYMPEDPSGETRYGYGWVVASSEWGKQMVWHNGSNGVFYADVRRFLDDKVVVIFLTNALPNQTLLKDLIHVVFELPAPAIPAQTDSFGQADLAAFAGNYRLPSRVPVEVRVTRGQLEALTPDPEAGMAFVALTPSGADSGKRFVITDAAAKAMLERLAAADQGPLVTYLEPPPAIAGQMTDQWRKLIDQWRAELGLFAGARILGSRISQAEPSRRFEIYAVMRFAKGAHIIRLVEREGEGPSFRSVRPIPPGPTPPTRVWFVGAGKDAFVTFLPSFGSALKVRFERARAGGAVTGMTLMAPRRAIRAVKVESR